MFTKAFRRLLSNKTFSLLNILGLATGIACSALIFLWVEDEVTYNKHFANRDHLYCILENQTYNGNISTFWSTPGPMAAAVKAEIPGIEKAARMTWTDKQLFSFNDNAIFQPGSYADADVLSMFSVAFIKGNAQEALVQPNSLVITRKMAHTLFGNIDSAMGKSVKVNNEELCTVTGVVENMPSNSSISFQWLLPIRMYEKKNAWVTTWGNNGLQTFLQLKPEASLTAVNNQLYGLLHARDAENYNRPFAFPITKWRLYSYFDNGKPAGGRIKDVRLFAGIAWVILLIACINFMNLSTARSEKRAREVGVRKVIGARKLRLIIQFAGESLFMSFLSVLLAIGLIYLFLPAFNILVRKQLSLSLLSPAHSLGLLLIGLICGIVAGSYPALYLSSFKPIQVLKGYKTMQNNAAAYFRKGLVIFQFAISIILIVCTTIIYRQIQYTRNRQLGFDKENLLYARLENNVREHFTAVREELINSGVVANAAISNQNMLDIGSNGGGFSWAGKNPEVDVLISLIATGPNLLSTMGFQLKSGRDFYQNSNADSTSVIINERLATLMGKEGQVGHYLERGTDRLLITGIVKDFMYNNVYTTPAPLVMFCAPQLTEVLLIRLNPSDNLIASVEKVEKIMKKHQPGYPFEYNFADQSFNSMFQNEQFTGKLASLFAALAILISSLGLFGLSAFSAEQRKKEIGIRKVLGASVSNVTTLLSKEFLYLVLVASLIAFPLSWWVMNSWLDNYQYRITISWWIFVLAGIIAAVIALITISFQSVRAALSNPVNNLRTS